MLQSVITLVWRSTELVVARVFVSRAKWLRTRLTTWDSCGASTIRRATKSCLWNRIATVLVASPNSSRKVNSITARCPVGRVILWARPKNRVFSKYTPLVSVRQSIFSLFSTIQNLIWIFTSPCTRTTPTRIYLITGKPDPVANCTVINKTLESFHIRCSSGFDGGSRQRFVIEVREDTTNTLVKNMSNDVPEFVVGGLHSGFVFNIILYASNSKGRSQAVELTETMERLHSERGRFNFFSQVILG